MTFFDSTIVWAKGEAFEMLVLAVAGVAVLLTAGLLWKFGTTPVGNALPAPLVVVAMIFILSGIGGYVTSPGKIAEFEVAYEESPVAFITAEKTRVENFDVIYRYTIVGAGLAFFAAILVFSLTLNPIARAVAVALVAIGLAGLVIDMFSKERAVAYEFAIDTELARINEASRDPE